MGVAIAMAAVNLVFGAINAAGALDGRIAPLVGTCVSMFAAGVCIGIGVMKI